MPSKFRLEKGMWPQEWLTPELRFILGLNLIVRLTLAFFVDGKPSFLPEIQFVTPFTSLTRAIEGSFLFEKGVSPYLGQVYHQQPWLLPFITWLTRVCQSEQAMQIAWFLICIAFESMGAVALYTITQYYSVNPPFLPVLEVEKRTTSIVSNGTGTPASIAAPSDVSAEEIVTPIRGSIKLTSTDNIIQPTRPLVKPNRFGRYTTFLEKINPSMKALCKEFDGDSFDDEGQGKGSQTEAKVENSETKEERKRSLADDKGKTTTTLSSSSLSEGPKNEITMLVSKLRWSLVPPPQGDTQTAGVIVVLFYLFHPFVIVSTLYQTISSIVYPLLFIAIAYAATAHDYLYDENMTADGQPQIEHLEDVQRPGHAIIAGALMAIVSQLDLFLALLVIPVALLVSCKRNVHRARWGKMSADDLSSSLSRSFEKGPSGLVSAFGNTELSLPLEWHMPLFRAFAGSFLITTSGLLIISYILCDFSWSYLQHTFISMLSILEGIPNVGLFWYLFNQIFDRFRLFFVYAIQSQLVVYLAIVLLRTRKHLTSLALYNVVIVYAIITVLKPYPEHYHITSMFALLLTQMAFIKPRSPTRLVIYTLVYLLVTVLSLVMHRVWTFTLGNSNVNFIFVQGVAQTFVLLLILIDVMNAVRSLFTLPPNASLSAYARTKE